MEVAQIIQFIRSVLKAIGDPPFSEIHLHFYCIFLYNYSKLTLPIPNS